MIRYVLRLPGRMTVALLVGLVHVYQWTISPLLQLLGTTCNFEPSCSLYMIGALKKYGLFRGGWRGIRRICRCHPWNPGGYDPP
jgi:uncharacterized protein